MDWSAFVLRVFITALLHTTGGTRGNFADFVNECRMFLFFFVSLFLLTQRLCWWATSACIVALRQQCFANGFFFYLLRYHIHSRVRKTLTQRHVAKRLCPVSDPMPEEPSPSTGEGSENILQPRLSSALCPVGGDGTTATESDTGLYSLVHRCNKIFLYNSTIC